MPAAIQADGALAADEARAYAAEDFAGELTRLDKEIADYPDRAAARLERARFLERHGQADAAMQDYRWLLDQRPELPEAYNNMARLFAARGEFDRAINLLEQGLATDPVYQVMFGNLRTLFDALAQQAYQAALAEPDSAEDIVAADAVRAVKLKPIDVVEDEQIVAEQNPPPAAAMSVTGAETPLRSDGDQTSDASASGRVASNLE